VYAAYWVYSQTIPLHVSEYVLTASGPSEVTLYDVVTYTGTLTYNGDPVPSATIHLFQNGVSVVTTTTDEFGNYAINYEVTSIGDFDMKTGFEVS